MTREVSPAKVANAVVRAIRAPGVYYVTSGPIRPLLAFMELAPGLRKPALKRFGIFDMWRREAQRRQAGDDRPGRPAATPSNGAATTPVPEAATAPGAAATSDAAGSTTDGGGAP
jgi:hypothetical protein